MSFILSLKLFYNRILGINIIDLHIIFIFQFK